MSEYWRERFLDLGIDVMTVAKDDEQRRNALEIIRKPSEDAREYIRDASRMDDVLVDPKLAEFAEMFENYPYKEVVEEDFIETVEGLGKLKTVLSNSGHTHILTYGEADEAAGLSRPDDSPDEAGVFFYAHRFIMTEAKTRSIITDSTTGEEKVLSARETVLHEAFHAMSHLPFVDYESRYRGLESETAQHYSNEILSLDEHGLERLRASGNVLLELIGNEPAAISEMGLDPLMMNEIIPYIKENDLETLFPKTFESWNRLQAMERPGRISDDPLIVAAYAADLALLESNDIVDSVPSNNDVGTNSNLTCGETLTGTHYMPTELGGRYELGDGAREEALVETMSNIVEDKTGPGDLPFYLPNTSSVALDLLDTWEIEVDPITRAQVTARAELSSNKLYQCDDVDTPNLSDNNVLPRVESPARMVGPQ